MANLVNCPKCGRSLRVPDDLLGKDVKCPACESVFTATAAPSGAVSEGVASPAPPPQYEEPSREEFEERAPPRRYRSDLPPHRGTMVLVLGILSIVISAIGVILGPIAWIMGNNDLREMRAGRMDREGEGLTNAGRICGIIGTSLGAVSLLCCVVYVIIFVAIGVGGAAGARR